MTLKNNPDLKEAIKAEIREQMDRNRTQARHRSTIQIVEGRISESLASDTERLARRIESVMREINTHRGRVFREVGLHSDEIDFYLRDAEDKLTEAFSLVKKAGQLV